MIEGWRDDTYLILFDASETTAMTERYGLPDLLPGFTALGLRGWDDLIVRDTGGRCFTVPTVPITQEHLNQYEFDPDFAAINADEQLRGKIKWYVTPLVFGGDPSSTENLSWITLEQHPDAVRWWNAKYQEIRAQQVAGGNGAQAR